MNYKLIIFLTTFFLTCCSSTQRHENDNKTIFFSNGKVSDNLNCLNKNYKMLELSCHRLISDENIVIGLREFIHEADDHSSHFKKMTITLPKNIKEGEKYKINNDINVFYSYGLTYGLAKVGCFGLATDGTIDIISLSAEKIVIQLDVNINLNNPLGWKNLCKIENHSETLIAIYKPYNSLTIWDGVSDEKSWGIDEAHPR